MWRITNVVAIVITILFGPFYYLIIVVQFASKKLMDHETSIGNKDDDLIADNKYITWSEYTCRLFVSYTITFVCLILQSLVVAGVTIAQNYTLVANYIYAQIDKVKLPYIDQWRTLGFSLVVSLIVTVTLSIFKSLSQKLTSFERHSRWTHYRTHETFKVVLFSLLTLTVMGFLKGVFNCLLLKLF